MAITESDYSIEDRGWTSPCWVWNGARIKGYGQVMMGGKQYRPHRVMWEQVNGPFPEGLEPDHLCEQRDCIRPDHMEPVTHAENLRRSVQRGRLVRDRRGRWASA